MLNLLRQRLPAMFYAVAKGKSPGIFKTWPECQQQVKGFSGAVFKKFKTLNEAENFIKQNQTQSNVLADYGTSSKRQLSNLEKKEQEEIEKVLLEALEEEDMLIESSEPPKKKFKSMDGIEKSVDSVAMSPNMKKYGDYNFHVDSSGFVQVFTDGSCENNGKKHAIAGLGVYFGDDHPLNASEPVSGRATNNVGEIQASIKAIREAHNCKIPRLNIFTDSQFLINSVCKWMSSWKKNDWKLATGKQVANKIDFIVLDKLMDSGNTIIKWTYVPAHSGYHGNEAADKLAKEGARKQAF
ncbi:hypothetical protein ACKWTF_007079 [Chironomus riparius]